MAELKLAGNFIDFTSGWLGEFGHLQIVYTDGTIEKEIEVQQNLLFDLTFVYDPVKDHDDLMNTPHYSESPTYYGITTIDVDDRNIDDAWNLLKENHEQFFVLDPDFLYVQAQNSNSYAAILL